MKINNITNKKLLAYIIGVALGDGNLSNPNKRAVRLRITCDKKYPKLIEHIQGKIKLLFPENKVSIVEKGNAVDINCYSNKWEEILGWKAKGGSKIVEKSRIPNWITKDIEYGKECLRGLLQTDGSIYKDRGYLMVNFTSASYVIIEDVKTILEKIDFHVNLRKVEEGGKIKYVLRISKRTEEFIKIIDLWKS